MVLYTEALLTMLYSVYIKHQAKTGDYLMSLEYFRLMFEEQQEVITKLLEQDVTPKLKTEEKIWH